MNPPSSRPLPWVALSLAATALFAGCAHAPKPPLPPTHQLTAALAAQGQHGDLPAAARVRSELRQHAAHAQACLEESRSAAAPEPYVSTSPLYFWRGRVQLGKGATHPFALAFERCFAARLAGWTFEGSDPAQGVVLRLALWPAETDPQRTPWPEDRLPRFDALTASPLATHGGITLYAQLTQFTLSAAGPERLDGALRLPRQANVRAYLQKLVRLYAEQSRKKNPGVLVAKCLVTRMGRVEDCRVLRPYPGVQERYLSLLREQPLQPAEIQGIPVDYDETEVVTFN